MSKKNGFYKIELSALFTVIGIILLFSTAIIVTLLSPRHVDPSWTQPTTSYQVQMYEVSDPNFFISSAGIAAGISEKQFVYQLHENYTLSAFQENERTRIIAPPELEKYVTRLGSDELILTSHLLLLRAPQGNAKSIAEKENNELQKKWEKENPNWEKENESLPHYEFLELYVPETKTAFALAPPDSILENWVDSNFVILDKNENVSFHHDTGVIYVNNPKEYLISHYTFGNEEGWRYDPNGKPIKDLQELKSHPLGFMSRQELIHLGEHIYAIEGCWYCHSDQTRTLIQDVVLNGSDSYPAPPSSANEYIYQQITFPGTRRIGPDMSRVGVKRPSRDWHKGHFWSPKTASRGSIMPPFQHFFDNDPHGAKRYGGVGIPNVQFEAIYQYLMTKGTRITPPTQAWWLGKDPVRTKEIIEGERKLP